MSMEEIQNPSEIHSFLVNNVLQANVVDLSKKRKLLDKQLSLPTRKLKFRDGCLGSEHSSLFVGEPVAEDVLQTWMVQVNSNAMHHDMEPIQSNSVMDCNSFVTDSDCAMSQYTVFKSEPELPKMCTHYQPANFKRDIREMVNALDKDKPSTSSGSCGSNDAKDTLYSSDNRCFKKLHMGKEKSAFSDGQHLEFGYHADYICSDLGTGEIEESLDVESQDAMLYSNGMPSELFVLSSGRWKINQDAQVGIRKPTIDQEFEQYFSMLML